MVNFSPCWAHFGPLLGAKILHSMTISSLAPNSILWLWDYPKNRAYLAILMGFIDFPPLVVVFKTTTTTNIIPVKQKRGPTMDPVVVEAWNFSWDLRFDSIISCQGIEKKVQVYLYNGRRNDHQRIVFLEMACDNLSIKAGISTAIGGNEKYFFS